MTDKNLEQLKTAWLGETHFGGNRLGPEEIQAVLQKQSADTTAQFRVGLIVDITLKALAAVALLGLVVLFREQAAVNGLNLPVLAITLLLLVMQWRTLKSTPGADLAGKSLRSCLEVLIRFYRGPFTRSLWIAAVSGSLVFYVGVLYYSWFKYGGVRPLETDDYVVFISGLLLAFGINAAAQLWQARFNIRELEICLGDIDADSLSRQKVRQQRFRRTRIRLAWVVWALLGILVLAYFIAR